MSHNFLTFFLYENLKKIFKISSENILLLLEIILGWIFLGKSYVNLVFTTLLLITFYNFFNDHFAKHATIKEIILHSYQI